MVLRTLTVFIPFFSCSQKILRALLKDGRTVCRLPCEVCQKEMQYFEDSSSDVRTVTCSQCGESTVR